MIGLILFCGCSNECWKGLVENIMAENKSKKKFLVLSVVLHALFFAVLFYDWQTTSKVVSPNADMVNVSAVSVSTALPHKTLPLVKKPSKVSQHKAHHLAVPHSQQLKQKKITHQQLKIKAVAKRRAEQQAKEKAVAKRRAEQQAKEKAVAKHRAEQQARLKAVAKRQAEQQAKEKAVAKHRAEQQAKLKAAAKRRAEQQAKEKAALALKKKEALQHQLLLSQERAMNAQLIKQQKNSELQRVNRLEAARQKMVDRSKVDQYQYLIQQKVKRFWNWPLQLGQVHCRVEVTLADDGTVLAVHLLKSSGNMAFDNSAMQAVKRASPLPVPKEKDLYLSDFKRITMNMSPHGGGFAAA